MNETQFIEKVWDYYAKHGRSLPWREQSADGSIDPYAILVSELMLQQTQVQRVIPKYHEFLARFPTVYELAAAPLGDVLIMWSGLGYNRRAKFLHASAQQLVALHDGVMPRTKAELVALPGVGENTAGAIMVYAFNLPEVFIETNVRSVYIHHFFSDALTVDDKELYPIIASTIDHEHPREWYWAIMDYGTHLKATIGNSSRRSVTYKKQSRFEGSIRQIRGAVIRHLKQGPLTEKELEGFIKDARLSAVLNALVADQLITFRNGTYSL